MKSEQIAIGPARTHDGTEVVVDAEYKSKNAWIGFVKQLGEGNPHGVVVWGSDGAVLNYGASEEFKAKKRLVVGG